MPQAAKAHTKTGAKAFVRYFWQAVNYAQATGDTSTIKAISNQGCHACDAGIAAIDKTYDSGGRIVGGQATLSNVRAEVLLAGDLTIARVTYSIRIAGQRDDFPGTDKDSSEPGYRSRDRLELVESSSSWLATDLAVLK